MDGRCEEKLALSGLWEQPAFLCTTTVGSKQFPVLNRAVAALAVWQSNSPLNPELQLACRGSTLLLKLACVLNPVQVGLQQVVGELL